MGAWLVGGTPAAPGQPHGRMQSPVSCFQRWPHPRLPHPCQQQGHRRDVPCWDCASGTQQCGQTGHPAIPPAIFWLIAVPTNTPSMTLDVHNFLWTKARQRAAPRRAGAVQHPCSAPLGDMHSPGLPPEPPCSWLPPEPGAPSQASWRPGTARHRPCCHGEDFCATSHTKEIAPSLGCSANEEEEEKSGERAGSLPFFRSLFLAGGNDIKKKRQKRKWRGVGGARPLPCQMTKLLAAERDLCVRCCPCIEALLGDGSKAVHLLKEPKQQVTSRAACPSLVSQPPAPSEGLHLHPALLGAARLPLGSTVGSWGYMASKTPPSLCSPPA